MAISYDGHVDVGTASPANFNSTPNKRGLLTLGFSAAAALTGLIVTCETKAAELIYSYTVGPYLYIYQYKNEAGGNVAVHAEWTGGAGTLISVSEWGDARGTIQRLANTGTGTQSSVSLPITPNTSLTYCALAAAAIPSGASKTAIVYSNPGAHQYAAGADTGNFTFNLNASVAWVTWRCEVPVPTTGNQVIWMFSKLLDDLRRGLIPPHELRRRYQQAWAI